MKLTVNNYNKYQELNLENDFNSEVEGVAVLSGVPTKKMKTKKFAELKESLLEQLKPGTPVYMFKWKGKVYGYYPADLEAIGQVVEISNASSKKKWSILASIMFRELDRTSSWVHRNFGYDKNICGVKCKSISNFKKNYLSYKCKNKGDFNKTDLGVWDDFPMRIIVSNLDFLIGVGLNLSLNIEPSSTQTQVDIQMNLQTLLGYTGQYWTLLQKAASTQHSSDTQTSPRCHQERSTMFLQDKYTKQIRKEMLTNSWTLNGRHNGEVIDGFIGIVSNLYSPFKLEGNTLVSMHQINNILTKRRFVNG